MTLWSVYVPLYLFREPVNCKSVLWFPRVWWPACRTMLVQCRGRIQDFGKGGGPGFGFWKADQQCAQHRFVSFFLPIFCQWRGGGGALINAPTLDPRLDAIGSSSLLHIWQHSICAMYYFILFCYLKIYLRKVAYCPYLQGCRWEVIRKEELDFE